MQDVASSTGALNSLQGVILLSSPADEGMRLEYPFVTSVFFHCFVCVLEMLGHFFTYRCVVVS